MGSPIVDREQNRNKNARRAMGSSPVMADGVKLDVAISFLAKDEPTAAELYSRLKDGLSVFILPPQSGRAGRDRRP
jgi:hypothetical protein